MAERWTEYAVRDTEDGEIEGGPFQARVNAERWIADEENTRFIGPCEIVECEMASGDWTHSTGS